MVCSVGWAFIVVLVGLVLVELVVDRDVALLTAGPTDVELTQCPSLLEGDCRLLEQLEQGEERATMTRVLSASATRLRNDTCPRAWRRVTMIAACSGR